MKQQRYSDEMGTTRVGMQLSAPVRNLAQTLDHVMSIDIPITLSSEPTEIAAEAKPATNEWAATALTVMFAAAAVLFASFLVVVTGLA